MPGETLQERQQGASQDQRPGNRLAGHGLKGGTMKKVNSAARTILDRLTEGLTHVEDHRTIDNAPGSFMAVHLELIGRTVAGPLFSVAHYYEQNGDLMKDPDMVFLRGQDGEYYPVEFQQDNIAFYQRAIEFDDKGKISRYSPAIQADMAEFANTWMMNILMQQNIKLKTDPATVAEAIREA
jgi:hypothetical protein